MLDRLQETELWQSHHLNKTLGAIDLGAPIQVPSTWQSLATGILPSLMMMAITASLPYVLLCMFHACYFGLSSRG